jgi:hypothetical protein
MLTALGARLAEQVDAVCDAAERLFASSQDFDPATSERESLSTEYADGIRLVDGMVAPPTHGFALPDTRAAELFQDRWVCVVDAANPALDAGPLELTDLARLPWVAPYYRSIYVLGSMQNWLTAAQQGTSAEDKATAAGLEQYFAGMEGGRVHQRQPARQQPGRLGRPPGDQLGHHPDRVDQQRDRDHAETAASRHQHAEHPVGQDPFQLREYQFGAGVDGDHQPERVGISL